MKQCLAKLQLCVESRNLILRPFDQEVEYAEASSVVRIARIRIGAWRLRFTDRVRAGEIG
jgi:hypothetical protein